MLTTGFTLTLDGNPEEVQRILDAIGKEYQRIQSEAWSTDPLGRQRIVSTSLRGEIQLRGPLDGINE